MTFVAARLIALRNLIGRAFEGLLARWRRATAADRYRPEKHYMRGPGPKSSESSTEGR